MQWGDEITLVIGASEAAEELRRFLNRSGATHAGSAGHLRGLRRSLTQTDAADEVVVVCVALDESTLNRHGKTLRSLLDDLPAAGRVRSVGLLTDDGLTPKVAEVGCDVYVGSAAAATDVMRAMRGLGAVRSPRNGTHRKTGLDAPGRPSWRYQGGPARWRPARDRSETPESLHARRRPGLIEESDADRNH